MGQSLRVIVSAGFSEGHALPALALTRALRARSHEVLVELSERWREHVAALGAEFRLSEDYLASPAVAPIARVPAVVEHARSLIEAIRELRPDVVISDFAAPAPPLAAEATGVRSATLIPTLYPVQGPGLPPYPIGFIAPRTRAGSWAWGAIEAPLRAVRPATRWLRRVAALLEAARAEVGLPPLSHRDRPLTTYGAISDELALVATLPQLEYRQALAPQVHVTGPMQLEIPYRDIELPDGDEPLVLIAPSTVQAGRDLVDAALDALADEPVRVVATLNRRGESWPGPVSENATVTDWLSYRQVMPMASLVVSSGGHGTVVRSLSEGAPVLVCPAGADTAENGARVTGAGAGLMLPVRLRGPRSLRWAVRRLLSERRFAERARDIAAWAHEHDGAVRGTELIESYARR